AVAGRARRATAVRPRPRASQWCRGARAHGVAGRVQPPRRIAAACRPPGRGRGGNRFFMKIPPPFLSLAACAPLFAGAGCANVEVAPEGDPHRTMNGTVEFRADIVLPPDAVVVVRVVDMAGIEQQRAAATKDLPPGDRAKPEPVPQVLAEQIITAPKGVSIPFRIEL